MVKSKSDNVPQDGNSVTGAAKSVGGKIARGAEAAVDYVLEKVGIDTDEGKDFGVAGIEEHMDVIASCGKKIGVVDAIEANSLKLTRKDSPDDQHHFIPFSWISRVNGQVHLNKDSEEAISDWKASSSACGCDSGCD